MDQPPIAELLPVLYRTVLDAVADLEKQGNRREAAAIRADATAAYSKAWNEVAAQRLRNLCTRADRLAGGRPRPVPERTLEGVARRMELERTTA